MKEKSENRKALPKFLITLLIAGFVGGVLGFMVGFSDVFGLDTDSIASGVNHFICSITPWAIPVTSVATMGGSFLLYRSAAKWYGGWTGGDEDDLSEGIERRLNWVLLLGTVQLLVGLFFFAAASYYYQSSEWPTMFYHVAAFLLSLGLVIFSQQKVVDLTRRMNPEKKGSVYDMKFQKKWLETCDEAERQQIGQAAFRAYSTTTKVCLWAWVILMILNMVFDFGMMPAFIVLAVMAVMQVSYILECIRMSKTPGGPPWRC